MEDKNKGKEPVWGKMLKENRDELADLIFGLEWRQHIPDLVRQNIPPSSLLEPPGNQKNETLED